MSQGQQQRPHSDQLPDQEPIRYGDVFNVSGELASKPIAPRDAAAMQAAENIALGQTQRGGPAAVMQSAAALNKRAGLVSREDASDIASQQGVGVSQDHVGGNRVTRETVGGQVIGKYVEPQVERAKGTTLDRDAITIGEALEASSLSAGDKPVDQTDAAAIQAAEMRAIRCNQTPPHGLGAAAQSAATNNTRTMSDDKKITTLSDLLSNATEKLQSDKAVTIEDAERVIGAELRNNPKMSTTPGGVAESMASAANLNLSKNK